MWTVTIVSILTVLGTIALALSNHYASIGNRTLEYWYLVVGIALFSLAGLISLIAFIRWWFGRRFVSRAKQKTASDFIKKFTVRFDKEFHDPHCPVCLTELAPVVDPTTGIPDNSHFKCIPCNHGYRLTNEETGEPLTLREAQALLSPKKLPSESKLVVIAETEPPPTETPQQPKALNEPSSPPTSKPKLESDFGVLWDENNDPFCPVCEKRLIPMQITQIGSWRMGDLKCMSCEIPFILKAGDGSHLTVDEAKLTRLDVAELRAIGDRTLEIIKRRPRSQATEPTPYEPDEIDVKILVFLAPPQRANVYVVEIANQLNLDHSLVDSHLGRLLTEGYVKATRDDKSSSYSCSLTPKGKEFLNRPVNKVPHPSGELSQTKRDILVALSMASGGVQVHNLTAFLQLSPVRVEHDLEVLQESDYVTAHSYRSTTTYLITDKGKAYLLDRNII